MAFTSSMESLQLQQQKEEPNPRNQRKVSVVYYLCRNGQLDHPHFMELSLSSTHGLFLSDVIKRLNILRGKGMATQYSWSSKRSYRNGYVWQDLSESDLIHPTAGGQEYVLKGSEIKPFLETPSPDIHRLSEIETTESPAIPRRRHQTWNSVDLTEYKVYKTESGGDSTRSVAADASTQTENRRRRENSSTVLSREEISPPPSDSSSDTLDSLMKSDQRLVLCPSGGSCSDNSLNRTVEKCPREKTRVSTVLMQLISCGSFSFKDCGPSFVRDQGLSLIGHYKARLGCGVESNLPMAKGELRGTEVEFESFGGVKSENKEYFSGSLIESKKEIVPGLKRSYSCNADR